MRTFFTEKPCAKNGNKIVRGKSTEWAAPWFSVRIERNGSEIKEPHGLKAMNTIRSHVALTLKPTASCFILFSSYEEKSFQKKKKKKKKINKKKKKKKKKKKLQTYLQQAKQ